MIPGAEENLIHRLADQARAMAEAQVESAVKVLGIAQDTYDNAEDKAAIGKALVHIERAQAALNDRFKRDG